MKVARNCLKHGEIWKFEEFPPWFVVKSWYWVEYHFEYAEAIQFTGFEYETIVIFRPSNMNAPYSIFT